MTLFIVTGLSAGTGTSAEGPALWISGIHADSTPTFLVTPSSVNFGEIIVSEVFAETVLVSNNSSKALFITSVTVDSGEFSVSPASATVDPFGSTFFVVTFAPTVPGGQIGNVVFVHNGTTSPDLLPLIGTGKTGGPTFLVTPSSIDFGAIIVSEVFAETVLVSNSSSNTLFITSVTVDSGEFSVSPASATVNPFGSTFFIVTFAPTVLGDQIGNVVFVHNGSTSPDLLPLIGTGTTGTDLEDDGPLPKQFALRGNYPNPFNPTTRIVFDLPKATVVSLTIYNALGARVAEILDQAPYEPGTHELQFDGTNVASGVYFYRLRTPEFNSVKKMVLLK